jgi:hypothetical protein
MWARLKKELGWLVLAILLSLLGSPLFWLLYRLNDLENGEMTMKVYWVGCMVVIGCIYIARFVIRFLKNAAEA